MQQQKHLRYWQPSDSTLSARVCKQTQKIKPPSLSHFWGGVTLFVQPITGLHLGLTARETALLIFAAPATVSFQSTPVHTGKRKPHYKQTNTHKKRLSPCSAPMTSGAHKRRKCRQQYQLGKVEATSEHRLKTDSAKKALNLLFY